VTYRVVVRPQVEDDIAEAADWYETQSSGLGWEFVRLVREAIAVLSARPLQFRRIHHEVRRAPVRRFPYGVLYRVRDQEIVVVACMHARRDSKR
jgi:plasmid stabilization system protein ParE